MTLLIFISGFILGASLSLVWNQSKIQDLREEFYQILKLMLQRD